jgi:hypothetical protein
MPRTVEAIRADFLPERVTTLFVGESAPFSGDFFYVGNTHMVQHMRSAVERSLGKGSGDFLERFKALGWYLDDLVLEPVNHLSKSERLAKCREAQQSLADRIAKYRPQAIVSLLLFIKPFVDGAAIEANSAASRYAVRFPGMGQQKRFIDEMANLVPILPKL